MDRIQGLLAQTMGDLELAATHLKKAIQVLDQAGWRVQLAWTCAEYADVLDEMAPTESESMGGTDSATSMRDKALLIAREFGMKPLTERIISTRHILKA
jgi:hypothetical protein